MESTPKSSLSGQLSLIKKKSRTGAPPPLYSNANDVTVSDNTTLRRWDKPAHSYLILDKQPCAAVGQAQRGDLCRLAQQAPRVREEAKLGMPGAGRRRYYPGEKEAVHVEQGS